MIQNCFMFDKVNLFDGLYGSVDRPKPLFMLMFSSLPEMKEPF